MKHKILVPPLNEGDDNERGTVVGILINVGDSVDIGDAIIEVETDKVTVEIPSSHAGIVSEIHVAIDDEVGQGAQCITLNAATIKKEAKAAEGNTPTSTPTNTPKASTTNTLPQTEKPTRPNNNEVIETSTDKPQFIHAGPSSRRLARELGVDISQLASDLKGARVSINSVKAHAKKIIQSKSKSTATQQAAIRSIPSVSRYGETWTEKLSKTATVTSANMSNAWSTIPHAWLQEKVDITELEEFRQAQKKNGVKITITVIIAKAIAVALKQFPKMNSSFDQQTNSIIYKKYVNIGIAVDTPHGLVVPGIRQVDNKSLVEISSEIRELSEKANNKKLMPADLQGSGITLSNLGGIGLTSIYPIVNWPQVAIIGVAGSELTPKLINGELSERRMVTLTLGFDHRVINGAEGARFLVYIKSILEDIRRLIL